MNNDKIYGTTQGKDSNNNIAEMPKGVLSQPNTKRCHKRQRSKMS